MNAESILIIEDEKLTRWSLRERLEREGFRTEEADGGVAARRQLGNSEFDLIILDHRLPDVDGLTPQRSAVREGLQAGAAQ